MLLLMFIDCGHRKCCGGINTNKYQRAQTDRQVGRCVIIDLMSVPSYEKQADRHTDRQTERL